MSTIFYWSWGVVTLEIQMAFDGQVHYYVNSTEVSPNAYQLILESVRVSMESYK